MKTHLKILLLSALFLGGVQTAPAGVVHVQDISLIRTHLWTARRDLTEQILQGTRQLEQIQAIYSQIQKAETMLKRLGDPREVTLSTLREALRFLDQLNLNQTFEDLLRDLKGEELHHRQSSPVTTEVPRAIRIDGQEVARVDSSVFRPEVAVHRASENYQEVRDTALEERVRIKDEINRTLQQLRSASTTAEIQKLNIVMRSLESQLAANDREIGFASSGLLATHLRNENEKDIAAKLEIQRRRAAMRHGAQKDLELYRINSEPIPFKR